MSIASVAKTGLNYAGRLLFDDRFASKVTSSIKSYGRMNKINGKGRFNQFHKQVGTAFQKAEKATGNKKVFASLAESVKSYKTDVSALWKSDKGFWKKIGGTLKGLGKRAPLIGTALMIAFELPNIFKATKEGGLVNGAIEVGKSGVRLAAGIACGAIGTAVLGPVGGLLGFFVGDLIGKVVVGKSYSEKQAEEKQKIADGAGVASNAAQTIPSSIPLMQTTMTPEQLMVLQQLLYSGNNFPYRFTNPQNQLNVTA